MMSRFLFFLFFILCTFTSQGQLTLQQQLQAESDINTQFSTLLSQSKSQDADFKLIRRSNVEIIRKNVNDSLHTYKKEIAELKAKTGNASGTISNLQDTITSLQQQLAEEKTKTQTIGFLGTDMDKGVYHTIVWAIICTLAIALFILAISFKKARVDAIEHQKTAEEVQNDFQTFKKKAMEKEQLLRRQLLDEQLKKNS
ncbi:hypothetical protein G5B30_01680 [Sphingobacterium sp. SGG-5]|uniref:hypothetical protein n=1 Tax=Sphingobacterium sp. SGG-5 TaxID=2710881 RepID=UPI0013ECC9FB|nr:hypothetical protein [Sphingobacterium sp. SGG-5]NGM60616.1 hypothetical protein [Sphingobacterium sp. SGG-5]